MKTSILAISMIAALAAAPSANATQAAPSGSDTHLVCQYGQARLRLTCWNSNEERVYSSVPFGQVFADGWTLIEAYTDVDSHYWVLERTPVKTGS